MRYVAPYPAEKTSAEIRPERVCATLPTVLYLSYGGVRLARVRAKQYPRWHTSRIPGTAGATPVLYTEKKLLRVLKFQSFCRNCSRQLLVYVFHTNDCRGVGANRLSHRRTYAVPNQANFRANPCRLESSSVRQLSYRTRTDDDRRHDRP